MRLLIRSYSASFSAACADTLFVCPSRDGDRDWQHGETDDSEARNREHKIAHHAMYHAEMLAAQRESPLQQEQCEKQAAQQRPPYIIHQGNFWH
jgi:hypothetical protein